MIEKVRAHSPKFPPAQISKKFVAGEEEKFRRAHVLISGRVQGVFFRDNTQKKAKELGVFGWVRNLADGKVEAVFEGEKEKVEKLINWVKRGPFLARVNGLEVGWEEYRGEFKDFEIKYF